MFSNDIIAQQTKDLTSVYIKPMAIIRTLDNPIVPKGTTPLIDTKSPLKAKSLVNTKSPIDIKLLVNTKDLMQMLSCGKPSAIKIGEDAHAKVCIGRKILWNVEYVKKYINSIAE